MKTFFKIILWILAVLLMLIGVYHLFNGGIDNIIDTVSRDGFFGLIKEFFVGLWDGIVTTFGF